MVRSSEIVPLECDWKRKIAQDEKSSLGLFAIHFFVAASGANEQVLLLFVPL
jgi:hypothetical protein